MAGMPGRSGGHNKLSAAEHLLRGTFRKDRHALLPVPAPETPVSKADRRRVVHGLDREGRRLAGRLLDEFGDWHASSLHTLRLYVESCRRLAVIVDDDERGRELRLNLGLLKALDLR